MKPKPETTKTEVSVKTEEVKPEVVAKEQEKPATVTENKAKPAKKKKSSKKAVILQKIKDYLAKRNNRVIIGNWKTNKKFDDIKDFAQNFNALMNRDAKIMKNLNFIVGIAPSMIGLLPVAGLMKKWVYPVAQFVTEKEKGAFTGQVSYTQVHEYNVNYSIVGHSETRPYLGVTDKKCHDTIVALISDGMRPIICVGETAEEKDLGNSKKVIALELMNCLKDLTAEQAHEVIIAYEPIWAIGAQTASIECIRDMGKYIREVLTDLFDEQTAKNVHVLYGGVVNQENAYSIMKVEGIDGVLVGGASLDPDSFFNIVRSAPEWDYVKRLLKPDLALDPKKAKKIEARKNKKYKIKQK